MDFLGVHGLKTQIERQGVVLWHPELRLGIPSTETQPHLM